MGYVTYDKKNLFSSTCIRMSNPKEIVRETGRLEKLELEEIEIERISRKELEELEIAKITTEGLAREKLEELEIERIV